MKKLVFTFGLCLVTAVSFGQKKAVTDALRLAKDSKQPNFSEARAKIKAALQHDETKNDAKTWYTAGQIENLQFDKESTKLILGQQPNETVMYEALFNIYPFFEKTYQMDMLPDAKGNVKPKFSKDMRSILKANLPHYINGGIHHFDNDSQKAYEFFNQYITISDWALLKEGETATSAVDSNYIFANFYAALAAISLDHETAVYALKRTSKIDYRLEDVFKYLAQTYYNADDTENFEKALVDGLAASPKNEYFLINLVNIYLESDRNDKALENTLTAISIDPNNYQLYNVAGFIYEKSLKQFDKAEEYFKKAIELDDTVSDTYVNLGRIFFNQGVVQLELANEIADVKKYNEERDKAKDLFRKSLPYFEKGFQLDPNPSMDIKITLRSIYYNLDMGDKLEEMTKIIGDE